MRPTILLAALAASAALPLPSAAQLPTPPAADTVPAAGPIQPLVVLGGEAEDRLRVAELLGQMQRSGALLRSASTLTPALSGEGPTLAVLAPAVEVAWNSGLPFSLNDGPLWAGRGAAVQATAGVRARYGPVSLVLAPQLVYAANRAFQTLPYPASATPRRSPFADPWYGPPQSIDLPPRHGDEPLLGLDPGQSSLTVDAGAVALGVATENVWLGPGMQTGIVLSSNAPGVPHAFARTEGPLATPWGRLEGRWMVGALAESDWFDRDPDNDRRTLSALAITFRPALEPDLEVGAARLVVRNGAPGALSPLDVFRSVGRPHAEPADTARDRGDADQLFSLFARWVFPASGFETYLEWARFEQPVSLRDFLETPNHSQGYTLGLQWATPARGPGVARLQGELSFLEPSSTYRTRDVFSTYTSASVPQGFTHRGQVLGAATGPASSSQWLRADYLAPGWRVGASGGRVRWNNDVLYTLPPGFRRDDVSLFGALEGALRLGGFWVAAELGTGTRFNYLFQAYGPDPDEYTGVDLRNRTLRLSVTPALGSR